MKSFALLSLPFLASAGVINDPATLEKRQFLSGLLGYFAGPPREPVLLNKALKPELSPKPGAKREKLVWGPFKMGPSNGTHTNNTPIGIKLDPASDTFAAILNGICTDCMVLAAQMEISDEKGHRLDIADGIYTHHFITVDVGRPQLPNPVTAKCSALDMMQHLPQPGKTPTNGIMAALQKMTPAVSVFIGKGEEGAPAVFSAANSNVKSGFYVDHQDKIYMTAEVVNYKPKPRDIYVSLDYEFVSSPGNGKKPDGYMDVGMGSLNIDGCMSNLALAPPHDKAITYTSPEWNVTTNGYLVNISPHVHDGAINIKVFLNGKHVCTSSAIYGGAGGGQVLDNGQKWETITSFTLCRDPVKIMKGDKLVMSADYDLTKHRLRPQAGDHTMGAEGMALANFIFAEAPDQTSRWTGASS